MDSNEERSLFLTRRIWTCDYILDANCVNARKADPDLNRLDQWYEDDVISLVMSEDSSTEAATGSTARRRKAYQHIYMIPHPSTFEERERLQKIESIVFPGGARTPAELRDVRTIFTAGKYMHKLITNDGVSKTQPGGILGNAARLKTDAGVTVLRPREAVVEVRAAIQERDRLTREYCTMHHRPLPAWVGKD